VKFKTIVLLLLFQQLSWAQDERVFRKAVLGAYAPVIKELKIPTQYGYRTNSDMYRIDLTGDGYKEGIVVENIDGENWFHLHSNNMRRIISFSLEAVGVHAYPYKVVLSRVSEDIKVLQIYFYEGYIRGTEFHGSARLYLITYRNNNLKSAVLSRGPQFFLEARERFDHYFIKKLNIHLKDLNGDGIKEFIFTKHSFNMIYILDKEYHWVKARDRG
jgi:hypothetical protein